MMIIISLFFLSFFMKGAVNKSMSSVVYYIYLLVVLSQYLPIEEMSKVLDSYFYLDTLSLILVLLSIFLTLLMYYASFGVKFKDLNYSIYLMMMMVLLNTLVLTFLVNNLLMFYFLFEVSLLPTLIIIMGWGYQPERLQAGVYFMMYTLSASLPLLLLMFISMKTMGSFSLLNYFYLMSSNFMNYGVLKYLVSFFLMAAFLVKMPMFMVHLWLPKAHLEAPVAGSMILAGVLLKLGGYGICRVYFMGYSLIKWMGNFIIGLSIAGMFFIGVACCRLNDMKALVAYSSVAHMGLVLAGIFSFFTWGLNGGFMMMLSHGLVSSGLFCSVNLFYERLSSRSLFMNKGLLNMVPIFCLLIFILCCFNISAPPSINLLSEFFLMISVLGYDYLMMLLFPLGSFMGAVFTFYMFSYSQHGKLFNNLWGVNSYFFIELHLLVVHLLPVVSLVLNSNPLLTYM